MRASHAKLNKIILPVEHSFWDTYMPPNDWNCRCNVRQLASTYKRLYPLFQQAYVDLGYPNGYFNNRLVEVIDHLLATPELEMPAQLTQPSVYFEFADPELEQRSAGQKLLIRLGNNNAAAVKLKLRELRREVAKQPE